MVTQPSPDNASYQGFEEPGTRGSDANAMTFLFQQMMAGIWTSTPVKVMAVTNDGAVSPVGFVDVLPMIHQVDGAGNATPHGVIHNLPYNRLQGGANAVIIDPEVGDLGVAFFAMRDISAFKTTLGPNIPGSSRRYDPADGFYFGGILNVVPTQYVRFTTGLIEVVGTSVVNVMAPTVNVNASGTATVTAVHCDLISNDVNLGATGGKKVVLDGDSVVGGHVVASSTKVKAT